MTTRLLPPAEWGRLAGTETESATKLPPGTVCHIVVVENGAGEIVGSWALFQVWHAEGVWVAPEHRGRGVARLLIKGMRFVAKAVGASVLWGAPAEQSVVDMLTRLGAEKLPGTHMAFSAALERSASCRTQ